MSKTPFWWASLSHSPLQYLTAAEVKHTDVHNLRHIQDNGRAGC